MPSSVIDRFAKLFL